MLTPYRPTTPMHGEPSSSGERSNVARRRLLSLCLAVVEAGEHVLATAKRLLRSSAHPNNVARPRAPARGLHARRGALADRGDDARTVTERRLRRPGQCCEAIVENAW
jgi:hypothetical protein